MTVPRLLISGIGKRNETLRLLARECATHGVEIVGCDASPLAPARAEVIRFERLPLAGDGDFGRHYAQLLAENDVTAYLSLVDPEITVLGELAANGELGDALFLHPDAETARVCEDKFAFFERMQTHGISTVPTSLSPPDAYPYIRKDRRGSRSSGFRLVDKPSRAVENQEPGAEYVFQPFHAGRHYCVDVYFSVHSGALVDLCAKEVLAKQDGESFLLRSVPPDPFIDLVRQVGQDLPMRGIVNFDVYDDGTGPTLMEVNCRIGGNYPAAHAMGANLLRHLMAEAFDGKAVDESFSDYTVDTYVSKFIGFSDPYAQL
ncbi:ATP-grasp domain-containing protein [Aeromicrobium sp.]|uniref:ATP-grasp domain-containing protein n=1 Tax=Aeromicrobium sp. TaxID=1871063 RepID=UPI003D6AADEC